jgi:hypothetical protein
MEMSGQPHGQGALLPETKPPVSFAEEAVLAPEPCDTEREGTLAFAGNRATLLHPGVSHYTA